ncbi:DUF4183 domain-containing protein [Paenibacillus mendelii]|uniref:DUF4183 domain-containing protein n=1 Tax=Paenibacillus mendelii TaxID=206163 RepID=A0ABV6J4I7_9BACL|nr:DUF4183 domain-containing protein [Paenibacillus mendelii]MCQ6561782.1 DUF4183 domain-containing protein [Paenibacillus mendelii]
MALQIFQIVFPGTALDPERFFHQVTGTALVIAAAGTLDLNDAARPFSNDAGTSPVTVPLVSPTGYYNFYANGVMQEGGAYSVDAATSTITFNVAVTFPVNTILILEAITVSPT